MNWKRFIAGIAVAVVTYVVQEVMITAIDKKLSTRKSSESYDISIDVEPDSKEEKELIEKYYKLKEKTGKGNCAVQLGAIFGKNYNKYIFTDMPKSCFDEFKNYIINF